MPTAGAGGLPGSSGPAATVPAPPANADLRAYPFSFHGNGTEFFRIWIVNIALTVLTVGFYLPWARVRTRRYFYGNTLLNDRNFDYLAKPTALLKGYLIVVGGMLLFNLASALALWWLMLILVPLYIGVFPWLIFKSLRFKCHNTAYSNVRLRFTGSCSTSYLIYLCIPLLFVVGGPLAMPFQAYMIKKYFFDNLAVGESESETNIAVEKFYLYYLIYLVPIALVFFIAFFAAAAVPIFAAIADRASNTAEEDSVTFEEPAMVGENLEPDATGTDDADGDGNTLEDALRGLAEADSDANAEHGDSTADGVGDGDGKFSYGDEGDDEAPGDFENIGAVEIGVIAGIIALYAGFILLSILFQQFVFVKTTNYTMTNTTLGSCRLHSDMRVRDVVWIMFSNVVLSILTLGIYIPWAMVRLRKYRIEHMKVFAYGELQEFVATKEAEQDAIGDAAGDYFDFEVGF